MTFKLIVVIITICVTIHLDSSLAQAPPYCSRFVRSSGPVLLDPTVSSRVASEDSSGLVQDCLISCWSRGCVAVSLLHISRVCQLLFINDASSSSGPAHPESLVWRSLGSEAGAEVWKAIDIESVIQSRRLNVSARFENSHTGSNDSIRHLSINVTACYRVEAWGAAGGSNNFTGKVGGSGASMSGRFNLTAGSQLSVVVGQAGGPAVDGECGGGDGGGSFVFSGDKLQVLVAAGGGGGASVSQNGSPGQLGPNGTDSTAHPAFAGFGGAYGSPGFSNPNMTFSNANHGGCGAGWLGRPLKLRRGSNDGGRGGSFKESWVGGVAGSGNTGIGGFGGGGGAGGSGDGKRGAEGGGGGFSGGGAGLVPNHAGGGGGSACFGLDCSGVTGGNSGSQQGRVELQLVPGLC